MPELNRCFAASQSACADGSEWLLSKCGNKARLSSNNCSSKLPSIGVVAWADAGAGALVQVSAIGADVNSEAKYARSKGEGEAVVRGDEVDAAVSAACAHHATEAAEVIGNGRIERGRIVRVRPGKDAQHGGAIGRRPRHRPRHIQRLRKRHRPLPRHRPKRRRDPLLALLHPLAPGFLPELIRSAATTHALGQFWRVMSDLFIDLASAEADGRVSSIAELVDFIKLGLVAAAGCSSGLAIGYGC